MMALDGKKLGGEWQLAEKPSIQILQAIGYAFIERDRHDNLRDAPNQVLFRPFLIDALQRLNGISLGDATAAFGELQGKSDNEEWLSILRGNFSRNVEGQSAGKTLRVIDFLNPENNHFVVTNQLLVKAEKTRIADLVVYVNGIPLVVIEAKSPLSHRHKNGEAFEQIRQYEAQIPRLFASNQFNIVTDGASILYGATGSSSKFYGYWRDAWPKSDADFGDELSKGLWSLLEPSRLLDLIAHFIVFERDADTGKVIKKICRYHQFKAVNKLVNRVVENKHRKGLVWHTQGSGKSLTMVFAALKLKTHRTISADTLTNPNLMVLTDRIDLDDQISSTFTACGLPNPISVGSVSELRKHVKSGIDGLTVLSTIFKFAGSTEPVPNSDSWVVMVDECHRTQEKDLGAYLRATLPDARFFGFTGTPIKRDDKDTYTNFGVENEGYLDKYGIDDAVRDGATVPIYYTGRKTDWHIDEGKIDILFDQWFADLPDDKLEKLKERGVSIADLVRHPTRIELIAYDIWTHFKAYALPDGFKAQIVAIDREAVILYKQALDRVIVADLVKDGMTAETAQAQASAMSVCVYSKAQDDDKPSEDPHTQAVRDQLKVNFLDRDAEKEAKSAFNKRGENPQFLIVCDKLLTGFDAPAESVMYLDKPLKEHSLLQAIARTNRVADDKKKNGLIVDYIGVSQNLDDALSSYRADDVQNAMRNLDDLRSQLKAAHAGVMQLAKGIKRHTGELKVEYDLLVKALATEDKWIEFKRKAKEFIGHYEALSPDASVLAFTADLKWVANFIQFGTQAFEKREAIDHTEYSAKIRQMLDEHLDATGLSVTVKLRHITDPDFWDDFEIDGKDELDIKTAAIRKTTELKKTTYAKLADNQHRYAKFSDRLRQLLEKMDSGQLTWAEKLNAAEEYARELQAEDEAHTGTGLSEHEYGMWQVISSFIPAGFADDQAHGLAKEWTSLYSSNRTAPALWQEKQELRKTLRQHVRASAHLAGFEDLKGVSEQVEDFALKHLRRA